ncbi:hypothetical protein MA16_Dca017792 [Dendrobium catenatum]|uniref:Uncharacterized protein n=1 Tax=Dendrobium catenatum TaxID=906689 RepID=A0A2I0VD72_9ASPA|nr:hypothetical protein MA16_Dca017792 [Dendrobium catenatum]
MHIEKNFLDNIFKTIMDVKGKSKENVKARMDIKEFCRQKNLELVTTTDGKLIKPKAPYSFTLEQKRLICQWFKGLKMPDGYGSNISRCVDLKSTRLFRLKSHDCHIIMEVLFPIIVCMLPDYISNLLTELSIFFKDLCSSKLSEIALRRYEDNIPIILCKLEKIFPSQVFLILWNIFQSIYLTKLELVDLYSIVGCILLKGKFVQIFIKSSIFLNQLR